MEAVKGKFQAVKVLNVKQEAGDVKTFVLDIALDYKAGQFLTVLSPDGKERRSYSFSTSPETDEQAAITVKRIPNGLLSRHLADRVKTGDRLSISGPSGFFTVPENVHEFGQIVFLAAGIGITPVISLVKTCLYSYPDVFVLLVYSNRSVKETVFYEELQQLLLKYPGRLAVEFLFSTAPDLLRARLNKQLLPELLGKYVKARKEKTLFYMCGPFPYMRMVHLVLEEERIPAENIKKEHFSTSVITQKLEPPDKNAHIVRLNYRGDVLSFESQYPDTILSAAKKQGINLPYSCENGICGSCSAICSDGKVWHRNNEVLTEADLKKGMILTCTGYPVQGDIELKIK